MILLILQAATLFLVLGASKTAPQKPKKWDKLTLAEVEEAQRTWGDAVVAVGKCETNATKMTVAKKLVAELYGYNEGKVLFKPTKAAPPNSFRLTSCGALSYFIGEDVLKSEGYDCAIVGDTGFALQPWSAVQFDNAGCSLSGGGYMAQCMGTYTFTAADGGEETPVQYSFVYKKTQEGVVIMLHHSSLPYDIQAS